MRSHEGLTDDEIREDIQANSIQYLMLCLERGQPAAEDMIGAYLISRRWGPMMGLSAHNFGVFTSVMAHRSYYHGF